MNHLKRKIKTYKTIYGGEVAQALERIWEICGQICSKRLQPYLPETIKVLERCKEINITKATKELLLKISSASIDRCLRPVRIKSAHGLSTTKPGSLLKNLIPVRTFTEWDEERPGFIEIDLAAHYALWEHHRRPIPEYFDLYLTFAQAGRMSRPCRVAHTRLFPKRST